jgi:hypothetical protein
MNQEAIDKLKEFQIKNHLSGYNLQEPLIETNSISEEKPKRAINYPKHIKPLQDRIMSAVTGSGLRTPQAIASYCGEDRVKVVNMHLGRLMASGKLVRYTNKDSGITRYYTPDEAKAKGYKPDVQPKKVEKRSSSVERQPRNSDLNPIQPPAPIRAKEEQYILFLEKRILEWQTECRKLASEAKKYASQISELEQEVIKAKTEPRNVTGEVTEVMEEVTKLRATVEYLESKLFGSK